jgi:selenide,water dikinase
LPSLPNDPRIVVDFNTADDAAAYRLDDGRLILQSLDFFTPIVDDPYQFGQIAAANALSDIYAMGGTPLLALNIVCFPRDELPLETLTRILQGGQDKAHEAGIHILGGHTIDDPEPKYGLVVTGVAHEEQLIRNDRAQPGDLLVLTKPLGIGAITTAIKQGKVNEGIVAKAVETMSALNRSAAEAALDVGVHAMTDVTGFGLLGHLLEMCIASGVQAALNLRSLPVLPGATDLIGQGAIPGGTRRNLAYARKFTRQTDQVTETELLLAADAQTSGGLLIVVSPEKTDRLVASLKDRNTLAAHVIGEITGTGQPLIDLHTAP